MAFSFNKFLNGSNFYKSVAKYRDGTTDLFADVVKEQAIGEAVDAPAEYTLLARIKAMAAGIPLLGWGWESLWGVSGEVVTAADVTTATPVTGAPGSGLKTVIDSVHISSAAAITVDLQEETTTKVIAKFYMPVNSTVTFKPEGKLKLSTSNKKLMVHASGAGAVSVLAIYHVEP